MTQTIYPQITGAISQIPNAEISDHNLCESVKSVDEICPVCGGPLVEVRCKLMCFSRTCLWLVVQNCSES